ncbi:MAG: hypothetical protein ACI4AD_08020 [Roseburia sp.]
MKEDSRLPFSNLHIYPINIGYDWSRLESQIEKDMDWFENMGGTAAEILNQSGIRSAYECGMSTMQEIQDDWKGRDIMKCSDLQVAVEAYVKIPGEEWDQVALIPERTEQIASLSEIGEVEKGKKLLEISDLYELAGSGYRCFVQRRQEKEGKRFARYAEIFGDRFVLRKAKLWQEGYAYAPNGCNYLLLANDRGHYIIFRPDFYAVTTCANVLRAEEQIRENVNPSFSIERIDYEDQAVWAQMQDGAAGVFLLENHLCLQDYPECYRRLAYQTGYLMQYYAPYYANAMRCGILQEERIGFREAVCKKLGVILRPADINHSEQDMAVVRDGILYESFDSGYLGDRKYRNEHLLTKTGAVIPKKRKLRKTLAMLIQERSDNGPYRSTLDLIERICRIDSSKVVELEALSRAYNIALPDGDTGMIHWALFAAGYDFTGFLNE